MRNSIHMLVATAILFSSSAASAQAAPKTAEAVIAADRAWGAAEVDGNTAFVEALLLPGYQSISEDGKSTSREAIIASVRKRGGRSEKLAAEVAAWKAAHPTSPAVKMYGDTAILTWNILPQAGSGQVVSSSDIFVYRNGSWHAQHSRAST